jgi:hypothetical protein
MNNSISIKAKFGPMQSIDGTTLTGDYQAVAGDLTHAPRIVIMQNMTDKLIYISQNGIDDHLALSANSSIIIDLTANKTNRATYFAFPYNHKFYAKYADVIPTEGDFYISYIYGE